MEENSADELAAYEEHLRSFIADVASKSAIPGICIELSANGSRVGAAVGTLAADSSVPMTSHARFDIGIVGNLLVSLAILDLASNDKLNIEAPISIYLPELAGTRAGSDVQLWHLLCHGGGYQSVSLADATVQKDFSWMKLVAALREMPFLFEPGTVFSYSSTATALLREIIHRITGETAVQFVRLRFLDPLKIGVGSSSKNNDEPDVNVASHVKDPSTRKFGKTMPFQLGEFWTSSPSDFTMSVADLITLHEVIVNARESQSDVAAIVHRNAALALQKQVIGVPLATGGPTSECLPMSSGLGAPEFLPEWYGCNGAFFGQSCGIRYHAKQKIVVVVAMNVHAPSLCDVIIHEVLRSLVGDVKLPQPKIEENFPVMEEMIGNYNGSSGGNVSVTSQGKDIVCQLGGRLRGPRSQVLMKLDAFNRWVVRSDPGPSSLGVFRDPITGTPCLMVGAIAYRKSL